MIISYVYYLIRNHQGGEGGVKLPSISLVSQLPVTDASHGYTKIVN